MAVAAILCSIGYVCCAGMSLCKNRPGDLYIAWENKGKDSDQNTKFTIRGSSEALDVSTPIEKSLFDGEEWKKIPIYDCKAAMGATTRTVQSNPLVVDLKIAKYGELTFRFPFGQYAQLAETITDAVALWTENGWERVCTNKLGYVYILEQQGTVADPINRHVRGSVYRIRGASGDEPKDRIKRLSVRPSSRNQKLLEVKRFQVTDCEKAISDLLNHCTSEGEIKRVPKLGTHAFYVNEIERGAASQKFLESIALVLSKWIVSNEEGNRYPSPPMPQCTDHPGNVYILWSNTGQHVSNFTISGYSETSPHLTEESDLGDVQFERMEVYDCLAAMNATSLALRKSEASMTDMKIENIHNITFSLPLYQYGTLVGEITDALALWMEVGWERVCKHKDGFVYILEQSNPVDDRYFGRGWVYRIKAASGDPPEREIQRLSKSDDHQHPMLRELDRLPVFDCRSAMDSLLKDLDGRIQNVVIKKMPEFGKESFYIQGASKESTYKTFLETTKQFLFMAFEFP